jgi:mono/diheme cytochrome c family protein
MTRSRKSILLRLAGWLGLIVVAAAVSVYAASERMLRKVYVVPETTLPIPTDRLAVERGEHLVKAVAACVLCHGEDLGGKVYAEMGPVGMVAGRNLTRGQGGIGGEFSDADWVHALRYGVRRDRTTLIMMPSEVYTKFTDADLGAVIAYVKQVPPVDREVPQSRFGPVGRALLAVGRMNILTAPKTFHVDTPSSAEPMPTAGYGRYLADISGCHGCHGFGLSGGKVAGPDDLPPASNLTPAGIGSWTESDFFRALRQGRRPDGTAINEFMPWRNYAAMGDLDLRALWLYLRSVPPKASGGK